jgi:hypothetical protein
MPPRSEEFNLHYVILYQLIPNKADRGGNWWRLGNAGGETMRDHYEIQESATRSV